MDTNISAPVLPAEIFELIINFCAGDSNIDEMIDVLRSCCLVSKYFVPMCRQHLFKAIEIGFDNSLSLKRSRLVRVLENDPTTGSYVKDIRYIFNSQEECEAVARGADGITHDHASIDNDDYPVSLHTFFPNVCRLWVEHQYWRPPEGCPSSHSEPVCSNENCIKLYRGVLRDFAHHRIISLTINRLHIEAQDIFALHCLRRLSSDLCEWPFRSHSLGPPPMLDVCPLVHLENVYMRMPRNIPPKLFQHFPNLVHIDLYYNSSLSDGDNSRPFAATPFTLSSQLKTVALTTIQHLRELMSYIPSSTPLPSLSTLKIRRMGNLSDTECLLTILERTSNIRRLELLSIHTYSIENPLPIDKCIIACGTSLQHVRLENSTSYESLQSDVIPLMCRALSGIRGANRLKTVQLDVRIWANDLQKWMEVTPEVWTTLDDILAVNSDFPDIEAIKISVDYSFLNASASEEEIQRDNEMMTEFWEGRFVQLKRMWEVLHMQDGAFCSLIFKPRL